MQNLCYLIIGINIGLLAAILYALAEGVIKKYADNQYCDEDDIRRYDNISFLCIGAFALVLACVLVYFLMPYIGMAHFKLCQTLKIWTIAVTVMAVYDKVGGGRL